MSGSFSDITERKRLEEHLRQAAKMEAVGRLAGGVAHDFNNLLTVIIGHSERLLKALGADDRHRRSVEGIRQAADRAASLTSQLLAFSRKQVIQPRLLDMNAAVSGLTPMLRRLIGENIHLTTDLDTRPCVVRADAGQVEQVLMNLTVNARDAMPQGGTLTIGTSITLSEGGAGPGQGDVTAGPYVCLTVRDTGLGMDAETKAHLFEPFFTTKERGKGTGLGLATVYGIVVQSGGTIEVDSSPELGTTFTVLLPRAAESLQTEKAAGPPAVETSHTETILLVEDDALVREFLCDLLEGLGYRVLTAASGEQAIQLCETGKEPVHVLLTDVVIPDMSGRVLAERAAALRPEMRVLFMSGYTDDVMLRHGVSEASAAFLQKPFRSNVLASKIREVLDAPRRRSP
jgi:nitrogen-specific signal transduction histidine kinase/CheY-like chemotaxis protein